MAPPVATHRTGTASAVLKANSLPRRAYVTFLAGDGDYWKGVVALAKGLRKVQSVYPLVVAVLPDVPLENRHKLASQGCIVREIEPVYPPDNETKAICEIRLQTSDPLKKQTAPKFAQPYYVFNYSKLRIWEFVEYNKIIYLDGDIQVLDNIDRLFDLSDGHFYAILDCFCEINWKNSPQYQIGYCQQSPEKVQWPEEKLGPKPPLYFNAGMFVFEPGLPTYYDLLETLKVTPSTSFAEQDFVNMFFRDVYTPLPNIYNLQLANLWRHPDKVELEKSKVVHYCAAGSKPWRFTGKEENMDREDIKMVEDKWWDIYNDETLDYWRRSGSNRQTPEVAVIDKPSRRGSLPCYLDGDLVSNAA